MVLVLGERRGTAVCPEPEAVIVVEEVGQYEQGTAVNPQTTARISSSGREKLQVLKWADLEFFLNAKEGLSNFGGSDPMYGLLLWAALNCVDWQKAQAPLLAPKGKRRHLKCVAADRPTGQS